MRAAPRAASVSRSEFDGPSNGPGAVRPLIPIGRLVQALDFERVLRCRSTGQSEHFAVHHLADRPSLTARARRAQVARHLSTDGAPSEDRAVDKSPATEPAASEIPTHWLGYVVPKRHAKRAVTRSLLKRQIRHAVDRHADALAPGLWVVRVRAPFDRSAYPSAASDALKRSARAELDELFAGMTRRPAAAASR